METEEYADKPIDITNEFALHAGANMPNHSASIAGRSKFVKPGVALPVFRTKQQAYRFAALLITMAEILPDEADPVTFTEVLEAAQS